MRVFILTLISLLALVTVMWGAGTSGLQTLLRFGAHKSGVPYNTLVVLMGTGTLGLASGVVGTFAVLRRRSLVGDAVAHAALPGLGIAFMIVGDRNFAAMLLGALSTGLFGSFCISWLQKNTRIKGDAAIGIVLSVLFGLGVVISRIVQDDPSGNQAGLDSFLLGKTSGMVSQDLLLVTTVALVLLVMVLLFYKEFKLISFDPQFASVLGLPVLPMDMLLMGLLVGVTIIGLPAVGVVLMAALLIIPGVAARFWTDSLHIMVVLSGLFGLGTGIAGTLLSSAYADLPAGPVIVLTGSVIFIFSLLIAPRRGVLARAYKGLKNDLRISYQNLLRTLFELTENETNNEAVLVNDILRHRSFRPSELAGLLRLASLKKDVTRVPGALGQRIRLTQSGLTHAEKVVRAHRLWEIFLVEQADIAPDHVHRDADEIEHVLTPEIMSLLEAKLAQQLTKKTVPMSIHSGEEIT